MSYQVIDTQTKNVVGTYSSRVRATRKADRLDLEYGAIRYAVEAVYGLEREGKYFQTCNHEEAPWQAVPFYPPQAQK